MPDFIPIVPIGVVRPFISPHPDGGSFVFWTERQWDPITADYLVSIFVSTTSIDGHFSEPIELVQGNASFSGLSIFSAPVIDINGTFTLVIFGALRTDPAIRYTFAPDFTLITGPVEVDNLAPNFGSVSLGDTYLTFASGETLIIVPDGQIVLMSVDGTVLSRLSGQGDLRQANVSELATGGFLLAIRNDDGGIDVRHYDVVETILQEPQRIDTFDFPMGFRDPVITALNGSGIATETYVIITSTRALGDVGDAADNTDTINIYLVSTQTGEILSFDEVSFETGLLAMSDAVVPTSDGGFALAIHYGPYGIGGSFAIRRYDANGVFRSEHVVGEGQGSSNNGGYDHQLVELDDGSLLFTWQTPTPEGGRRGGHLFEILPAELHGTDDNDVLYGGAGDDLVFGYEGRNHLSGEAGDDILIGGSGIDIFASSEQVGDYAASLLGADTMIGGLGDDYYFIDNIGDVIVEYSDEGTDRVITEISFDLGLDGQNAEMLSLSGTEDIDGFGNSLDNLVSGNDGNNQLRGGGGDDTVYALSGVNLVQGGDGSDTLYLSGDTYHTSGYAAFNVSSTTQVGTQVRINLEGLVRIEAVTDGGTQSDTIQLSHESDAFFLHDAYSGFHGAVVLTGDSTGIDSAVRFTNIEVIHGMGGDDIIDLTSSDYSLAGVAMFIDGGEGDDVIWGSDADETVSGGNGDDTIFGGIGTDVLTGGSGADVFEFTRTSVDTSVTDFNIEEGDTLRFYNTGGAEFDVSNAVLTADGITISYLDIATGIEHDISIALVLNASDFSTALPDVLGALEII